MQRWVWTAGVAAFAAAAMVSIVAQPPDAFVESRDHPAISYTHGPTDTAIDHLNQRLADGSTTLAPTASTGRLKAVLDALDIPVESQVAVFSKTSFEADRISPSNPRTIYFKDTTAIGWVRGSSLIEAAAEDPRQGVILYSLDESPSAGPKPGFVRDDDDCLICHLTWDTMGVPGFQVFSTYPRVDESQYANGSISDHRLPFGMRWGGWYLTGTPPARGHLGNVVGRRRLGEMATLDAAIDTKGLLSPYSDVVALMVLEHQSRAVNLMTRLGWEARVANDGDTPKVRAAAADLADYLLFVDEATFIRPARGSSGFAALFSAGGPRDSKGRSLRQLDLDHRLLKYPCSYMIYAPAFDALPDHARDLVYQRLWAILSGAGHEKKYAALSATDRRAVVEILRDTKPNLPSYFRS